MKGATPGEEGADPRAGLATYLVHPDKLEHYLLNPRQEVGAGKAARLLRHRFTAETLATTLRQQGRLGQVTKAWATPWGLRIEVTEPMMTPLNRYLAVTTVWQVDTDDPSTARFITLTFED